MKGKKLLLIMLAVVLVAAAAFIGWRIHEANQRETLYRAIDDAWRESGGEDVPAYLQYLDAQSSFEITDIEKGDPWVVTVTVHGLDLANELKKTDPAAFSGEMEEWEMNDYLITLAEQAESTEVSAILYAWPEGDGYRVQFSETFVDAMSGMVWSYVRDLVNEMTGGAQ